MSAVVSSFVKVLNNGQPNFGLAVDSVGLSAKVLAQITGSLSIDDLDIKTDDSELIILEVTSIGSITNIIPILTFGSINTMPSPAAIKFIGGFYYIMITFIGSVTLNNGDVYISPLQLECPQGNTSPISTSLLIKTDPEGEIQWTTEITGIIGSRLRLTVNSLGEIYTISSYLMTVEIVSSTEKVSSIQSIGGTSSMLLLKFDSFGELCWSLIGTSGISFGNDLSLIEDSRISVIGTFEGTFVLGKETIMETQASSAVFVAIVSSEGQVESVIGITSLVSGSGFKLTGTGISGSSSSLVITGEIVGSFFFSPFSITASNTNNIFIAKWNIANQEFDWVRIFVLNEPIPSFPTIDTDSRGKIYGSVYSRQNITVFDENGNVVIIISGQSEPVLIVYSISTEGNFIRGTFFEPVILSENEPLAVSSPTYVTGSFQTNDSSEAFIAGVNL